jgi:ribosomal protein S18 acetylase RimI-like enzyme
MLLTVCPNPSDKGKRGKKWGYFMKDDRPRRKQKKRFDVEIREMEIDDLPAVFHLGERLFTARHVPNLYKTWDQFEIVALFESDTEFCLVAELDGKIIGFALGTTISKPRSAWKYGHLVWLGVDPRYQLYGLGKRLFRSLKETMLQSGVRIILVDTEADNVPALAFFRDLGFGHPEEHIYMTLNLDNHKQSRKRDRKPARGMPRSPREGKGAMK